jgi:two-component system, chemotaxis family, sensor kinase CheA
MSVDDGLVQEFVTEAKEHLGTIEPDLLQMEKDGKAVGQEVINRIFRAIHSIKGASGFFGFERLKRLSHVMESVLMQVRDGQKDPTPALVEPLLKGLDRLNQMVEDIDNSETVPCDEEIALLDSILTGKPVEAGSVSAPTTSEVPAAPSNANTLVVTEADIPSIGESGDPSVYTLAPNRYVFCKESVAEAARFGQHFYQIELLPASDLVERKRTLTELVDLLLTAGCLYEASPFNSPARIPDDVEGLANIVLFYSSVLEMDLLCLSFDLDESRIKVISVDNALGKHSEDDALQAIVATQIEQKEKAEKQPDPKAKSKATNPAGENTETVRVRVDLLNRMMDLAGEMVLSRNQLLSTLEAHSGSIPGLAGILQNVDLVTSDLQEHIMQTRMQTVGTVFNKFPRVVRDIAKTLGKEIHLEMSGEDVELDKSIIESLSDPLTHLIRNCCDHGVEKPTDRVKNGKPAYGTIQLKAYHEAGQINIAIIDDGKGIDPHRIVQKALLNGAITENDVKKMSPQDMVNLIFLPGLSTAEKVSDISGRGVGMDVVRNNIEQIGGSIQIDSTYGEGTIMLLRLPLTLAIIPSLVVGVENQKFAMPQINVVEMVRVMARDLNQRIEQVGSASVLRLRGSLLPLVDLARVLEITRTTEIDGICGPDRRLHIADIRQQAALEDELNDDSKPENRRLQPKSDINIMVLKAGKYRYGLIVDELFDIEEIVVKPLSNMLKNCKCFAGATIMGDGRVAMILDASGVMAHAKLSFSDLENLNEQIEEDIETDDSNLKESVILFNIAPEEVFAISLSAVLRLEKINTKDIERIGSREFLPYRGQGLPLLRLENHLPIGRSQPAETAYLIIPKVATHTDQNLVGLVVTDIVDTLEVSVKLQSTFGDNPGVMGSALVNNHMTIFIDANPLLRHAGFIGADENPINVLAG